MSGRERETERGYAIFNIATALVRSLVCCMPPKVAMWLLHFCPIPKKLTQREGEEIGGAGGKPVAASTCATPEPELDQTSIFIDFILCAFLLSFSFFPALCAYVFLPLLSCRISHGSKYVERGNEPRLVIDNVTYEYQGEYECRATSYINGQERVAISDPVSLQVVGKSVCACQCVQLCFMYMLLRLSWPGGADKGRRRGSRV